MTPLKHTIFLTLALGIACSFAPDALAQSPYGFRGPERNGLYYESGLMKIWPEGGPQLLWETLDAGKGYSSPVIFADRLYLTGMNETEDKEIFSCYTLDGKKVYEVVYGTPWDKNYPETRTTPTIEDDKAYVISGSGEIVCLDIQNGNIIWKVEGGKIFERKTGIWGTAESPMVYNGKVIYTPAGDQTTMVALDAETGETVWKSPALSEHSTYISPQLIMVGGIFQLLGATGTHVFGINPDNGEFMWTFDEWKRPDGRGENIATNTPLFHNRRIFFSNGYNIGSFALNIIPDATQVNLAWRNDDLDTHHGGFVLVDDIIYGSNWINNNSGNWVAVDWNTGETKWETTWEGKGKGSIITADGMLYLYDERRGTVGLVRPNPEKFDLVSEFQIKKGEGPHWAHPVIDNGVLYIRHGNALMAYKIK